MNLTAVGNLHVDIVVVASVVVNPITGARLGKTDDRKMSMSMSVERSSSHQSTHVLGHIFYFVVFFVVVLGKGKGYGDIEYAMMRQLGACDEKTLVVTTVHESQLLDDLPSAVMTEHDL